MGLGSLIARLALDTRPYEQGLKSATSKSIDFGNNLDRQLGSKLKNIFGFAGLLAAGRTIQKFSFGAIAELKNLANANDLTVAQLVTIQEAAARAGMSFAEFSREVKKNGETLREFATAKGGSSEDAREAQNAAEATAVLSGAGEFLLNKFKHDGAVFAGKVADGIAVLMGRGDIIKARYARRASEDPFAARATGELFGPDLPPDQRLPGFELSKRTFAPNANALQQIGAFSATDQTTHEVRTAVTVLKSIDGTLKKVSSSQSDNLVLAP